TTPWTLPSNTALTVGSKIEYVLIRTINRYTGKEGNVILAKERVRAYFTQDSPGNIASESSGIELLGKITNWKILKEFKGRDLIGIKYEQLLPYALPYQNPENAFRIIAGDFVTTEDGTGIVHTAPTFGADDAKVAK